MIWVVMGFFLCMGGVLEFWVLVKWCFDENIWMENDIRYLMVGVFCVWDSGEVGLFFCVEVLDQVGVCWQVVVEDGIEVFDVVVLVVVQFVVDVELVYQLCVGGGYVCLGGVVYYWVEGVGGVGDDEYVKFFFQC